MSGKASISELEADIAARRQRLARTLDELSGRAAPKALVEQQKQTLQARFADATTTPSGDLRVERIAAAVAVVAAVVIVRVVQARRRTKRRKLLSR